MSDDPRLSAYRSKARVAEEVFAAHEESEFHVRAHRDRMLAAWVSHLLNHDHQAAHDYHQALISADLSHIDPSAIAERLAQDLTDAGYAMDDVHLREVIDRCELEARLEVES